MGFVALYPSYGLQGEQYVPLTASEVLPGLDLDLLSGFVDRPTTSESMRGFPEALRVS